MNVFTESELIVFLQVGSSNKGPSVGFVEVRGTPGDPVVFLFIVIIVSKVLVLKNPQKL